MRKKITAIASLLLAGMLVFGGCGAKSEQPKETKKEQTEEKNAKKAELEDGTYSADFKTDSGMFHVSEACDGKEGTGTSYPYTSSVAPSS